MFRSLEGFKNVAHQIPLDLNILKALKRPPLGFAPLPRLGAQYLLRCSPTVRTSVRRILRPPVLPTRSLSLLLWFQPRGLLRRQREATLRCAGTLPQQLILHRQLADVALGGIQLGGQRLTSLLLQTELETAQRPGAKPPAPTAAPTQLPSPSSTQPCPPPPLTSDSPLIRVQENLGRHTAGQRPAKPSHHRRGSR